MLGVKYRRPNVLHNLPLASHFYTKPNSTLCLKTTLMYTITSMYINQFW